MPHCAHPAGQNSAVAEAIFVSLSSQTTHFLGSTVCHYKKNNPESMRNVRMHVVFSSSQKLLPDIKFEHYTLHGLFYFLALTYLPLCLLINQDSIKPDLVHYTCSLAAIDNTQGISSPRVYCFKSWCRLVVHTGPYMIFKLYHLNTIFLLLIPQREGVLHQEVLV